MAAVLEYFKIGGVLCVLLSVFIEIVPIKINPIQAVVKYLLKPITDKQDKIEKKLDEHIAQSYRNKIMRFQDELLMGMMHSKEQFEEVLDACDDYEEYVKANNIKNGKCKQAIAYIKRVDAKCKDERSYINIEKECGEAYENI